MSSFTYINTVTLQYPLFQGDIRLEFPDMGAEFTLPDGYAEIIQGIWPENFDEKLFRVVEIFPENQGGSWHQRFELVAKTEIEIENEQKAYFAFLEQQKGTVVAQELTASGSAPNVVE